VRLGCLLLAGCCTLGPAERPFTAAELEDARASAVAKGGGGYESAVVPPFVVAAYGGRDLRADAVTTITWAQRGLRQSFFEKEPNKILTVWIYGDEESYMRESSATLGIVPDTPYGFYRPCSRSLVVNAGLGYGTLVHEMVHAYMHADFPDAPTWMQEGLASLYEAPIEKEGRLLGGTNWRLPPLQRAIESHRAPSFEAVSKGSRGDFDGKDGGSYYAVSRYLLYWLQERGQLERFYRAYRANVDRDARGMSTLAEVAGQDLASIRREWEPFVLGLRFRR
jgi:hypothetical protein